MFSRKVDGLYEVSLETGEPGEQAILTKLSDCMHFIYISLVRWILT